MDLQSNTALVEKVAEVVAAEVEEIVAQEEDISVAEIENGVRRFLHEVGRQSLQQVLSHSDARYPEAERACPHCEQTATYQRRREASLISLFGKVRYRRHYYLCAHCRQGHYPLDQRLGLQSGCVSAGLAPLLALLGIQTSFAESSDKLAEELLLVRVSDNTIRKETRQMGRLQMAVEQEQEAESEQRNLHQERAQVGSDVPQRFYGSLDGTIVPLEKEWRELKAGCWYRVEATPSPPAEEVVGEQPSLRATDLTYFCDIRRAEDFSSLFWATGQQAASDKLIWPRNWSLSPMAPPGSGGWWRETSLAPPKLWIGIMPPSIYPPSLMLPSLTPRHETPGSNRRDNYCGKGGYVTSLTAAMICLTIPKRPRRPKRPSRISRTIDTAWTMLAFAPKGTRLAVALSRAAVSRLPLSA